jgi:hypothetical protein
MYNLNYTPTTLGVQNWREIASGGMQIKKAEHLPLVQSTVSEKRKCRDIAHTFSNTTNLDYISLKTEVSVAQ